MSDELMFDVTVEVPRLGEEQRANLFGLIQLDRATGGYNEHLVAGRFVRVERRKGVLCITVAALAPTWAALGATMVVSPALAAMGVSEFFPRVTRVERAA